LKPRQNNGEFEHFRLMANIRYNYLVILRVEQQMNDAAFTISAGPKLLNKLDGLNIQEVDRKFKALNSYLILADEIEKERELRNYRFYKIRSKLTHITRAQSPGLNIPSDVQ